MADEITTTFEIDYVNPSDEIENKTDEAIDVDEGDEGSWADEPPPGSEGGDDEEYINALTRSISISPEDSSSAEVGVDIPLVVIRSPEVAYSVTSSAGRIRKAGTGIPVEQTQDITFANSQSGSLSNTPEGAVDWEWVGNHPGINPLFSGTAVTVSKPVTAILRCTYEYDVDRWIANHDEAIDAVCVAIMGDETNSCTISWTDETSNIGDEEVIELWIGD